jgi:hypothetical protein
MTRTRKQRLRRLQSGLKKFKREYAAEVRDSAAKARRAERIRKSVDPQFVKRLHQAKATFNEAALYVVGRVRKTLAAGDEYGAQVEIEMLHGVRRAIEVAGILIAELDPRAEKKIVENRLSQCTVFGSDKRDGEVHRSGDGIGLSHRATWAPAS